MTPVQATDRDDYFFDLQGFLRLPGVLAQKDVAEMNAILDAMPDMPPNGWHGHVHRENFEASRGIAYQQIYEAGEPFERLIDHPRYIELVKRYIGGEGSHDWLHGPLFIDENFASLRGPNQGIGMHSGGAGYTKRTQYHYRNGHFMCGQINILIALTDIGSGDGATMVIPGSHKSNFKHPDHEKLRIGQNASMLGAEGAIEVHLKAGDAILFVDAIGHGSAARINAGERRILVYRFGPSWGNFRFGYTPSPALLERLTPQQRQFVYPWPKNSPPQVSQAAL
jgi:hypothetical protein